MTQLDIIAFARHVVKRHKKRKPVKIPAMSGSDMGRLLRAFERAHGHS